MPGTPDTDALLRRVARTPDLPAPPTLAPGTLLEETYRIERRLGAGGMGVVYLARDVVLGRDVAIKLHSTAGGAAMDRLLREAQSLARLSHPNVVTVHQVGASGDDLFVAMEYIDGGTARTWLAERPRTWRDIVALYAAAARGLAAAHAAGLIHRDFKPDNVLVGRDGRVRVADFGLARPLDAAPAAPTDLAAASPVLTLTGTVIGTPAYMAPEQHRGAEVGPAADQFAFCATLWEALFARRPFPGDDIETLRTSVLAGRIDRPATTDVPRALLAALTRGLAVDPADRHPSMTALADELDRLVRPRRRALPLAAAAALTAIAAAAAWFLWPSPATAEAACAGGEDLLAAVWNGPRRDAVSGHLAASGHANAADIGRRTAASFDRFAARWLETRRAACANDSPADARAAQLRCLDRRLAEADATLAVLETLPAEATPNALLTALTGEPIHPCASPAQAASLPASPPHSTGLNRVLDQAQALARAHLPTGARLAALVVDAVGRDGPPAIVAAAIGLRTGRHPPDLARAIADLEQAREAARAAGDYPQEVRILLLLADVQAQSAAAARLVGDALGALPPVWAGSHLEGLLRLQLAMERELAGDFAGALAETRLAGAIAEPLPGAELLQIRVENQSGTALEQLGRLEEARDHHQRSLALTESTFGPESEMMQVPLTNLGLTLSAMGRHAEAILLLERWARLSRRLHHDGEGELPVAYALLNVGVAEQARGTLPRALAAFEQAHAIIERELGPDDLDTALVLDNMAVVRSELGQLEAALALARRALAGRIQHLGADHPDVAIGRSNLGEILFRMNRFAEAERELRAAVDIWTRVRPDDPRLAPPLINLGRSLRGLGRHTEAAAAIQRAASLREASGADADLVAATLTELARTLWALPARRADAIAAATRARDLYASLGPEFVENARAADDWLRARR
jgi:tetratricopeptide (TPR) repeat protein